MRIIGLYSKTKAPEHIDNLNLSWKFAPILPDLCPAAIEDLSAAIKIEPRCGEAWRWRGQVYVQMMELQKALADLEQCIALSPDPKTRAKCHFMSGAIHQKLGDSRRAAENLHVRHPICNPFFNFIVLPLCSSSP